MDAHNVPLGVYVPGSSALHRIPAGTKLLLLIIFLITSTIAIKNSPPAVGLAIGAALVVITIAGYPAARIPWDIARGQLITPLPLILAFGALLAWRSGVQAGAISVFSVYSAVVAATLVTLTTTVTAMMEALERVLRPLERIGFPVDATLLAFSLTIRLIPLMLLTAVEVLEAQKARGLSSAGQALLGFGVPLVVRALIRTKALGEAMISRGIGD